MKKRRIRELTIGAATRYGIAVTFCMALLILVILLLTPGTAFSNFFVAQTSDQSLPASSDLYQQLQAKMDMEETFILTPLCLFFGGLTLGRLAPSTVDLKKALKASAKMALGLLCGLLLIIWTTMLLLQGGHLAPGQLSLQLILVQLGCIAGWTATALIGTSVGVFWRDRSRVPDATLQKT